MIEHQSEKIVIKSKISELKKVEFFLYEIFKKYGISQKYFNKTLLCISEAVINSIQHGNKKDESKRVTIVMNFELTFIDIFIEDEGDGFKSDEIENPVNKKNLKKESGRGIHIIKSLSDNIEYNEKGNKVQIKIDCK